MFNQLMNKTLPATALLLVLSACQSYVAQDVHMSHIDTSEEVGQQAIRAVLESRPKHDVPQFVASVFSELAHQVGISDGCIEQAINTPVRFASAAEGRALTGYNPIGWAHAEWDSTYLVCDHRPNDEAYVRNVYQIGAQVHEMFHVALWCEGVQGDEAHHHFIGKHRLDHNGFPRRDELTTSARELTDNSTTVCQLIEG